MVLPQKMSDGPELDLETEIMEIKNPRC